MRLRTGVALAAALVGLPLAEASILVWLAARIGIGGTFLLVLVSGLVGGWVAKREGLDLLRTLSADLRRGLPAGDRLTEGALVALGGLLLVVPGVLTDLAGVVLLLRPTRRWLAPRMARALSARFGALGDEGDLGDGVRVRRGPPPGPPPPPAPSHPFASKFDDLP